MTKRRKKKKLKALKLWMARKREENKDNDIYCDKMEKEHKMRWDRTHKIKQVWLNKKRRNQAWLKRKLAREES